MHLVVEVRDLKLAQNISEILFEENIPNEIQTHPETGKHQITVDDLINQERARDLMVSLGVLKVEKKAQESDRRMRIPMMPVTSVFIAVSVTVSLIRMYADGQWATDLLLGFLICLDHSQLFKEISEGQIWRVFSPVFLHFGWLHIIFNMLCMKDLGNILELDQGIKKYLALILISGVLSNIGQYLLIGPTFGGMSGVIYAFVGFIWTNRYFNDRARLGLPQSILIMMIAWFLLCLFEIIPNVANMAHAVGLSVGMIFGMIIGIFASGKFRVTHALVFGALAIGFTAVTAITEMHRMEHGPYYQQKVEQRIERR